MIGADASIPDDPSGGDNTAPGTGAAATHTFTQAGIHEVELTAEDNAGRARAASHRAPQLDGGPVAQPDGRYHGPRPARAFKVG